MNSVFLRDGRYAAHVGEASPDVPATRLLVKYKKIRVPA
jgi:hypothetical protein